MNLPIPEDMREGILAKLNSHLAANYPEILVGLQDEQSVTKFLGSKMALLEDLPEVMLAKGSPVYIVEEMCMELLAKALGPSRFNYFCSLLQNEFESHYYGWLEAGILPYEVINLIEFTRENFRSCAFDESAWNLDRFRDSMIDIVGEYLKKN